MGTPGMWSLQEGVAWHEEAFQARGRGMEEGNKD